MRYSPLIYARALLLALAEKQKNEEKDFIVKRFLSILAKNGDSQLLTKIVEQLEELENKKLGRSVVLLETARELSSASFSEFQKKMGENNLVRYKINPSLIAGIRMTISGERELDLSFSRRLRSVFKKSVI